jgi:hypothetical protein
VAADAGGERARVARTPSHLTPLRRLLRAASSTPRCATRQRRIAHGWPRLNFVWISSKGVYGNCSDATVGRLPPCGPQAGPDEGSGWFCSSTTLERSSSRPRRRLLAARSSTASSGTEDDVCVTGRRLGELEKVSGDDWTDELMTRRSLRNATTRSAKWPPAASSTPRRTRPPVCIVTIGDNGDTLSTRVSSTARRLRGRGSTRLDPLENPVEGAYWQRHIVQEGRPSQLSMPRSVSLGLARAVAETPAPERGTWFDMCPGRGAKSQKGPWQLSPF